MRAFAHLALEHPDEPWTLEIIGSGALRPTLEQQIAALPAQPLRTASRSGAGSRPGGRGRGASGPACSR